MLEVRRRLRRLLEIGKSGFCFMSLFSVTLGTAVKRNSRGTEGFVYCDYWDMKEEKKKKGVSPLATLCFANCYSLVYFSSGETVLYSCLVFSS